MIDLTALTPFAVAFLLFGVVAAGLAVATLARLVVEATSKPQARPVVLVTAERSVSRIAA